MRFKCQTYHKYGEDDKYLINIYNDNMPCFLNIEDLEDNLGVYTSLEALMDVEWLKKHNIDWIEEDGLIIPIGLISSTYNGIVNLEQAKIIRNTNYSNNLNVYCSKRYISLFPKYLRMLKRLVEIQEKFESEIKEFQNLFNKGEK